MSGTQRLVDLFANVPGDDIGKAGEGRIKSADNYQVEPVAGPIASPREWLERFLIPIKEQPVEAMRGARALFYQRTRDAGQHVEAEVWIPIGSDINAPDVRWSVWHEIGHAVDQVQTGPDGKMFATAAGSYSAKHLPLLRKYQEEIILWSPNRDREYKLDPQELWAEVVACAICDPGRMLRMGDLWCGIRPDLNARNLPVCVMPPNPDAIEDTLAALTAAGWSPEQIHELPDPADRLETDIEHGGEFEGKEAAGREALNFLKRAGFIGTLQAQAVRDYMGGEEKDFFFDKMIELAAVVKQMPATYDTEGVAMDDKIAHLHYFAGGQANWYIVEKDKGDADDKKNGTPPQSQAFGKADLFRDGGEVGYISIAEILENHGELDFHWTPKPLSKISSHE
jgi:hypothetical protein